MAWPSEAGAVLTRAASIPPTPSAPVSTVAQRAIQPAGLEYSVSRSWNTVVVKVASDLSTTGGPIYFYWYLDGVFVGKTTAPYNSFYMPPSRQARIVVRDSLDGTLDPDTLRPDGFPARWLITWCRSLSADVAAYKVEQKKDSDSYATIGRVRHRPSEWWYSMLSGYLADGSDYSFRVSPVDKAGNTTTGTMISSCNDMTVRREPAAPNWGLSYDPGTSKVTFSEV